MPAGTCGWLQGESVLSWYKSSSLAHMRCVYQQQQQVPPGWILPIRLPYLSLLYPLRCPCYRQPYIVIYGLQRLFKSTWYPNGTQFLQCSSKCPTSIFIGLAQAWALQVWDSKLRAVAWHQGHRVLTSYGWNSVQMNANKCSLGEKI